MIKENLPAAASTAQVKRFLGSQLKHVLLYLPAALNMGVLLNDNTLDDNTHKMEGPFSSLLQSVANLFTAPTDKEELEKPA